MAGAMERRSGLPGAQQGPMGSGALVGRNPGNLIDKLWGWLFGKKKSTWTAEDEARDVEARRRVAEQERQFYESRK